MILIIKNMILIIKRWLWSEERDGLDDADAGKVKFQHMEDSVHQPVSFSSHHTYLGMPQVFLAFFLKKKKTFSKLSF